MRDELEEALCRDFPNLYRMRNNPKSLMFFGFEIKDGWEPIVRALSEKLERTILSLPENEREALHADQVKQKFGELRFYMSAVPDAVSVSIYNDIDEAEARSRVTCEQCGKPGEIRPGPWLRTLCALCYAVRENCRLEKHATEKKKK